MIYSNRFCLATICLLALLFPNQASVAQTQLPDTSLTLRPVLVSHGRADRLRVTVLKQVPETKTVSYTVEVPYTETVTKRVGSRTVTVPINKYRTETRTKTVSVTREVPEQIELLPGEYKLRRTDGGRVRSLEIATPTPALVSVVADLSRPTLPPFYQQVLSPGSFILYALDAGTAQDCSPGLAIVCGGGNGTDASAPHGAFPEPLGPGPNGEVDLTIVNRSGRAVEIFFSDEQQREESYIPRLRPGQSETLQTYVGHHWIAKADGRPVSIMWAPEQQSATWEIGPPVSFTSWQGTNGVRFTRVGNNTWRHYDENKRLVGQYTEEERTDEFVAAYDQQRQTWLRLYACTAECDQPGGAGWQQISTRPQEQEADNSIDSILESAAELALQAQVMRSGSGDKQGAIKLLRQALQIDSRHAETYHQLAITWREMGDPARALKAINRAIALDSSDPEMYENRGHCHADLGNIAEAQADFAKAQSLAATGRQGQ